MQLLNAHKIILIDEIENGIHHSKLNDFWKVIIEIIEKENIQLFVTSHDVETIEALNNVSENLEYENITSIKINKNNEHKTYPVIRKYDSFNITIDYGLDVR
jgi:AAA15 family ATPase/GTPase